MNKHILNNDSQEFINNNLNSNLPQLLLKGTSFEVIETKELIAQIEAKKRCEKKLPTWFNTKNIYYPNKLNIEQTSSETTAQYKASLIRGKRIIDLTGGFGVDCLYFSKHFKTVTHCEINPSLSEIVKHNFTQFGIEHVETLNTDGIAHLKTSGQDFDWIYIDPSRRHESKGKVFFLKDCLPNIPEHLAALFEHSNNVMIKTSPLLDFSVGINELNYVKTIHVVAVNNEVKELLWILEKHYEGSVNVETIDIRKESQDVFTFLLDEEKKSESNYELPLRYLYEPNSAILKAGGFQSLSKAFHVYKLHKHSHLYTSTDLLSFPGRPFIIENVMPFNKKTIKQLAINKANVTTRNFPLTVQQIRKKFKIGDGGDLYLFFTTNRDEEKVVIITKKA